MRLQRGDKVIRVGLIEEATNVHVGFDASNARRYHGGGSKIAVITLWMSASATSFKSAMRS